MLTDLTAQRDNDYAFRTQNTLFGWVLEYRCARTRKMHTNKIKRKHYK